MNCSEFEKRIYLYRELTAMERKQTDEHIAQCDSCRELSTQLFQQQELIRKISTKKMVANEPQQLTRKIMNSVERLEKRKNPLDGIAKFLDSLFVRYALGVISILLIVFYAEQQIADQIQPIAKAEIRQGPVLNTTSFLKTHMKTRESRSASLSVSRFSYHRSERVIKTL
jgi:predicted anti-sigma-YlaC factor YlaD